MSRPFDIDGLVCAATWFETDALSFDAELLERGENAGAGKGLAPARRVATLIRRRFLIRARRLDQTPGRLRAVAIAVGNVACPRRVFPVRRGCPYHIHFTMQAPSENALPLSGMLANVSSRKP
jgi:hypothetical protein